MKPAKWLSSPRWMGPRPGKVRTQCGEEGGGGCRGGGAEEGKDGRTAGEALPLLEEALV